MAGWVGGIRRALVLGLVLIAGTAIEQARSVGPQYYVLYVLFKCYLKTYLHYNYITFRIL